MINYIFSKCDRKEIVSFIEKNHYSHNMNGVMSDYCFKITDNNDIVGAMVFGKLGMAGVWKKYGNNQDEVIELRRLVCIDDTPRNTESWFIGKALNWLLKNTAIKTIISYADMTHGHEGIIYKASNFQHLGITSKGKMISWNGKLYHDKAIRTTYNGKLKPYAQRLKNELDLGNAVYVNTLGKHIYKYSLQDRRK